mmetsp:Transcript_2742/g.5911  ORF Transcript_2742/g.5911 Transcript_2742/m.5911 type:complete len:253 (-) Transcript_2742:969-1727(-)
MISSSESARNQPKKLRKRNTGVIRQDTHTKINRPPTTFIPRRVASADPRPQENTQPTCVERPYTSSKRRGEAKIPTAMSPHIPPPRCTGTASQASSIFHRVSCRDKDMYNTPPRAPTSAAAHGSNIPHPPVMATSPVRVPLRPSDSFHATSPVARCVATADVIRAERHPADAPSVVDTADMEAILPKPSSVIRSIDPQLKPYHPNHRRKVPRVWRELECPLIVLGAPRSSQNRPLRGPSMREAIRAVVPPVR